MDRDESNMEVSMAPKFPAAGKAGAPPIGILLSLPSPEIAEIAVEAGFDWLFLDMEHGLLDVFSVQRLIQAVAGRVPCIIRAASHDGAAIAKALDTGADGLIFPHVNSAAEARDCVRAALYPPQGARSIGIARAQGYGARLAEAIAGDHKRISLIAQIEHIKSVRNIEEILVTAGLDALFIGPFDLSASLGIPGQVQDPSVLEAIGQVQTAARKFGIPAGIFAGGAEAARAAINAGFEYVCVSTDAFLFGAACRELCSVLRVS
jgi:2-keto-3-deoxy-L-rhamnonate aldolase RhmA